MDQRYKTASGEGEKKAGSMQWAGVHQTFIAADPSNFYFQQASAAPVEGIPVVQPFLQTLEGSRSAELYLPTSEGLVLLNSRPPKQDAGGVASTHSSREDDHFSNLSEELSVTRVKLLCSYGGKILPRPSDGALRYVGGETRMVTVSRDITLAGIMQKMVEIQPQTLTMKYQLPDEDVDALVSVSSEEDLENMMEEFDKLETTEHPRLRVFLFTASDFESSSMPDGFGDSKNTEQQYLDAVNGVSEGFTRKLSDASISSSIVNGSSVSGLTSQNAAYVPDTSVQQLQFTQAVSQLLSAQQQQQQQQPQQQQQQQQPEQLFVWSSEAPTNFQTPQAPPTIYAAVGVPFPNIDSAALYGNGPFPAAPQHISTWTPLAQEITVPATADNGGFPQTAAAAPYGIFSTGVGVVSEVDPASSPSPYDYSLQQPKDTQPEVVYLNSELQSKMNLHGTVQPPMKPPVAQVVNDMSVPVTKGGWNESFSQDSEHSALSPDGLTMSPAASAVPIPLNLTDLPVEPQPPKSSPLSDTLVNFLEDSLCVTATGVGDSCVTQQALHSAGNSSNMPFDLLTNDDFGRASSASTGSNLQSSVASSASYTLDSAAALSESPSKFLDNLNAGLLFPEEGGAANGKSNAGSQTSVSRKDSVTMFAFTSNEAQNTQNKSLSGRNEEGGNKAPTVVDPTKASRERCDRSLDTSDLQTHDPSAAQEPTELVRDDSSELSTLPDLPDIVPGDDDSDPTGRTAAETEAMARARGLQVIKYEDLEEIRELGSGTFGTVFHGKWRGTDVAIKRIKSSCFFGSPSEQGRLKDDFWGEACILARLHHPNIVAFYGVVPDSPGGTLATVTEFMVNGSLKQVLQKKDSNNRVLDRRRRLLIAMDAAFGMEYLHDKKIIHFDLKGENLLVNMRDPHRPVCKVGDLGLSKIKHKTMISGGVRGTLPWMAPELLNGKSMMVTEKVDIFSFGVVMWELLTGEEPYADLHYGAIIGGIVSNSLRPQTPSYCEAEWKSLMERCWNDDPASRPTFSEIIKELRSMLTAIKPQQQQSPSSQSQQQQQQQQQQSQSQRQ